MFEPTHIPQDKLRAYLATNYRIGRGSECVVLRVGVRSDELRALFAAHGVDSGAFLTACNPQGRLLAADANARAHAALHRLLLDRGLHAIEGEGSAEGADWPAEASWFALGLSLTEATEIGVHFNQDAIVWVAADAVPELIRLR